MFESILAQAATFAQAHPFLMVALVWPVVSSLLLTLEHWLELAERQPRFAAIVAVVRALGLDPVGLVRAVRAMLPQPPSGDEPPRAGRGVSNLLLVVGVCVFTATTSAACSPKAVDMQTRVAASISAAANSALPALRDEYKREGRATLAEGLRLGESRQQLRARLDALDARWGSAKEAWEAVRLAHESFAVAVSLEQAGRVDVGTVVAAAARLRRAWCTFALAMPARAGVPDVPMAGCGARPAQGGER